MDYLDDNHSETIEDLVQSLEDDREMVEEILEDQISDVESEIEKVGEVYEENASKLWESIESLSEKLSIAERSAGQDEREIRDRLARLYRELRRERREEVENRLELKMRKWDLERELEELDGFGND